ESVASLCAATAHGKGLDLVCNIDPAVPQAVIGDPLRVRQILENLLSNAVKFTQRGEIGIEMRQRPGAPGSEPLIELSVRDTGIGIDPQVRQRLFQPFSQGDESTTRRFG